MEIGMMTPKFGLKQQMSSRAKGKNKMLFFKLYVKGIREFNV